MDPRGNPYGVKVVATLVAGAGLVLGVTSLVVAQENVGTSLAERSPGAGMVLVVTGWLAIGIGLVAWRRRGARGYGLLLVAAGFAWFLAEWNNPGSGSAPIFSVGLVLYAACPPLVAHAALAYPAGRLASPVERLVLAVAYAGAIVVLGLLPALLFDPAQQGCGLCPTNLVSVAGDASLVESLDRFGVRLGVGWSFGLAVLVAWRLARSSSTARHVRAPVLVPAVAYLVLVGVNFVDDERRGTGVIDEFNRHLRVAQGVALVGVALGVCSAWIRSRRAREAVTELVVELGRSPEPGGLRNALAETLGDDDLALAYAIGEDRYVDASGRAVTIPVPGTRAVTPVERGGQAVALLIHRPDLLDDPTLVDAVAVSAGLALDNERLQAQARAQLADLKESRARIIEAGDRERRRLERDLHDGAQQRLVALALGVRLARGRLGARDGPTAAALDDAAAELREAIAHLRQVAEGIHPAVLSDEGLAAALAWLADGATARLDVVSVPEERLPAAVETAVFLLVAEALSCGPVRATARRLGGSLIVDVETTGRPHGLVEVEDRVGALDGRIAVRGTADGQVHIGAEIPCA